MSKFARNISLVFLALTAINSFCINTKVEYHDIDAIRKIVIMNNMGNKEIKNLMGNLTDDEIIKIIEKMKTGQSPVTTWRDIALEGWNSFLLGLKIGAILFIPCYLIEKYFGYRPRIIVY